MSKISTTLLGLLLIPAFSIAQENYSTDELFSKAREQAFEKKNYPEAIKLTKEALQKSPDYTDISVFLGRLYTWSDQIDSARMVFKRLDERHVENEDFYLAYASLEYWNDQPQQALAIVDKGLTYSPNSEDLLYLKARIDYSEDKYEDADKTLSRLLALNTKHTEGRALAKRIQEYTSKNALGLSYNFSHFDKQFEDNWHIISASYRRRTAIGSVIFKTNYANKFASNGLQFELEAYPRISKMFYMYVGAGYSNHVGIFPNYRSGASLYANLPKSFEGELGFRQLYFSSNLFMYTASVGKYYQNYWFNLRTFITPADKNVSHSYTGTVRYYTGGANDYLSFMAGTGISPDDSRSYLLGDRTYKLKTFKVGAEYNFSIKRTNLFSIGSTYFNQEYKVNEKGNQIDFSVSYTKTF